MSLGTVAEDVGDSLEVCQLTENQSLTSAADKSQGFCGTCAKGMGA